MGVQEEVEKAKQASQRTAEEQALTQREGSIFGQIEKQIPGFKLALPDNWDAGRFARIAITALKKNDKLRQAAERNPASLFGALMLSAQLGLEPNSPLHEAVLIPYGNNIEFQLEYRGLLKLMWNSGMVQEVDFDTVCENDEFEYTKGTDSTFMHKPDLQDRGKVLGYYAYVKLENGGFAATYMSKPEVIAHGKRFSKTYNNGPWQTDFDAMALKTVLKQLVDKKAPKSTQNESLQLAALAAQQDMRTKELSEDSLAAQAQSGQKIEIGDIDDIEDDGAEPEDAEVVEEPTEDTPQDEQQAEPEPTPEPEPEPQPEPEESPTETPEKAPEQPEVESTPPEQTESPEQPENRVPEHTSTSVPIDEMPTPKQLKQKTDEMKFDEQYEVYRKALDILGVDITDAVEDVTTMRELPEELAPITKGNIMNQARQLYKDHYEYEMAQLEQTPSESVQDELDL